MATAAAAADAAAGAGAGAGAPGSAEEVFVRLEKSLGSLSSDEKLNLVSKTNAVFQFDVGSQESGQPVSWVLVCKGETAPKLIKGTSDTSLKPDIKIGIPGDALVAMASGKVTGQKLFMAGKLKLKGNMMLAMKLDPLFSKLRQSNGPSAKPGQGKNGSDVLRAALDTVPLDVRARLVSQTKGVFEFHLSTSNSKVRLDLKNTRLGAVIDTDHASAADVTVIVSDTDFAKLVSGALGTQAAFSTGKIKIKGSMMHAMKIDAVLKEFQKSNNKARL